MNYFDRNFLGAFAESGAVSPDTLSLMASLCWGLAVGGLAWGIFSSTGASQTAKATTYFELSRRAALRTQSSTYRWFERLIDEFVPLFQSEANPVGRRIHARIQLLPESPPWAPGEFSATKFVEGLIIGALLGVPAALWGGILLGLGLTLFTGWGYMELCRMQVIDLAEKRMRKIKARLPYTIDLIALTMEAGAGFQESLEVAMREQGDHPIGEELREIVKDVDLGQSNSFALEKFANRVDDNDAREIVRAAVKAEELGTPLKDTLREQAEQLRLKQSQWVEIAAADAQVKIVFPGMIVMIACLMLVVTPFLLKALAVLGE